MAAEAVVFASRYYKRRSNDSLGGGAYLASADDGGSLAGDFDAQFRQVFSNIAKTLSEAGCTLTDIVSMTVFLIDARYTTRMTELRTELFGGGDFPASAAISVTGFAQPGIMLEIQCVAVRP